MLRTNVRFVLPWKMITDEEIGLEILERINGVEVEDKLPGG
jgi:hypothetical protein